jgi:hypothetical protein
VPLIECFTEGEARVEDADTTGEAFGEATDGLGGEGDLWDEDDATFTLLDGVSEGVQIDFGLAGAGDAVENEAGTVLAIDGRTDRGGGLLLCADQFDWWATDDLEVTQWVSAVKHFLNGDKAASDEAADAIASGAAKVAGEGTKIEGGVVLNSVVRSECSKVLDDGDSGLVSKAT